MPEPSSRRFDEGSSDPLVLVPGIQGRYEWMGPTIHALSKNFRVLTFSLNEMPLDAFFDRASRHVERLLDQAGAVRATVVGVSFGGLIAAHFAATRPGRAAQLVIASSPSPCWRLDNRRARYVRWPIPSLPLFALHAASAMAPELFTALPTWRARLSFAAARGLSAVRWPSSPRRMAAWASAWLTTDLAALYAHVVAPTIVVTGEPRLDRVVPVASTLDYLRLIPHAQHVTIAATGHLGTLTRATQFAALVRAFAAAHASPTEGGGTAVPSTTTASYAH